MSSGADTLHIGPLHGGGLVLGYRCPARCRHCLYACGPQRRDGLPDADALEQLLDLLAARAPRARFHIGGGEPFLDEALLGQAVAGLARRGLALDYVETNASWVRDRAHAEARLAALRAQGLACVLVSVSPFHAEWVPWRRTAALIEAAEAVLPGGALVWVAAFVDEVASAGGARLDLDALLASRGDRYARGLAERYGLIPGGRAGRYLAQHGARRPWQQLVERPPCRQRLPDTGHFHVDGQGRYVPGLCAGLVLPLEELPGRVDPQRFPLLTALWRRGPAALVELAGECGFTPDPQGYSAACDLCTEARRHLVQHGASYAELGPEGFYQPASWPQPAADDNTATRST